MFMTKDDELVPILRSKITDEIVAAMGFNRRGLARRLLGPIFYPPAQRFSRLIADVDRQVGESGIQAAAGQLLTHFIDQLRVFGAGSIPKEGPLVVASNHPGAYDSVALLATIPRPDIKLVVSDVPFIRSLPELNRHMIYTPTGDQARMAAVRQAVRHLKQGGALLIFPSGVVDPDPAVLAGAKEALRRWFSSLDLMLKHDPEIQLVDATVSGVLAPAHLRSPLTRLVKVEWRQRKLAEFLQIMRQLLFGSKFDLRPAVSFGKPLNAAGLLEQSGENDLHPAILRWAERQLDEHIVLAGLEPLDL
jgi:1-acyl-sn-glycerol-3-phosphate acyltransferase